LETVVEKTFAKCWIALLCLMCALTLSGLASMDGEAMRRQENRALAVFPGVPANSAEAVDWPARFEAWFNDRLAFKRPLLRAVLALQQEVTEGVAKLGAVCGRDGWLYLFRSQRTLDQHAGRYVVPQPTLDAWTGYLGARRDYLRSRGVPQLVVLAPDKPSVYPEFLPDWARHTDQATAADRFAVQARAEGLDLLDLRPVLRAARREREGTLYGKTDTHWSNLGAYVAYRALLDRLGRLPGVGPLRPLELAACRQVPHPQGYDLVPLAGLTPPVDDFAVELVYSPAPGPVEIRDFVTGERRSGAGGTRIERTENVVVHSPEALNRLRVLVLRDSFTDSLSPMLDATFTDLLYTHHAKPCAGDLPRLLEIFKPDVVVRLFVERSLNIRPPTSKD
jgi:hypothetical protein